ncbi:putative ribonuclease H-like domain-containing protein [Tanacetum coccineum]
MQEELLQFKLQQVWTLVDLPYGKRAIRTKWVYRNKKDDRGIVIRNKAKLVAQGYTQEEVIDYDEVFAPVARIEAIRLFLAYASFKDFVVYRMDVKSAFLYGKIEEEVYVCQPPGFEDPEFPDRVYKVEKALYGLHQAPKAWYETLSTYLLDNGFQRGTIDKTLFIKKFENLMHKKFQMSSMGELTFFLGLQVTQKDDGIFISQDKYVDEILKKFSFSTMRTTSTPMETSKPLMKDKNAEDVDVHLYRSMIGSLIIFRYLKGQSKLGLWYPNDSPFDLEAYSDSDYAGASLDRKSTTGGCQFLGSRLISWQCKKQTVVANSTTEAEYVAASNCCGHVLWIQNQLLDYGYNFMNTKIFIDNESTICIVKNPMFHSKTKHIEIRHHFIRDSYEKRLIQVIKIHIDHNVLDLLTKAFDLEKSTENVDFDEIVDFLNASPIRYALTDQSTAQLNEPIPQGTGSGSGLRRQDTILGDKPAQTRFERMTKQSNDPPLLRVNTLGSGEDSMKLNELMEICTKLSDRVLAWENIKTTQVLEIINLKKRVKKLEKKKKTRTPQLKRRLFKVRIESSAKKSLGDQEDASKQGRNEDQDEDISWFQEDAETQGRYGHDIGITTAEPVTTASVLVTTASPTRPVDDSITDDITLAETLMKIKSSASRPQKAKGVVIKEPSEPTTASRPQPQIPAKDKGKGIMQELEIPVKVKGKDQIAFDEEVAQRLEAQMQAELEEE